MIPKIIHYCWFGRGELPEKAQKCIESWKKYLPDYEIKCWNEDNVNLEEGDFIRDAYHNKYYSFVSDFVRMKVMALYGGIYLDVDMEVRKSLNPLLEHTVCLGTDDTGTIETVMMAEPGHPLMQEAFQSYLHRPFVREDGSFNTEVPNVLFNRLLAPMGFRNKNERLSLPGGIEIYPDEYFQGVSLLSGKQHITENTYIIHWHTLLWVSWKTRLIRFMRLYILVPLMGESLYKRLTARLKGR